MTVTVRYVSPQATTLRLDSAPVILGLGATTEVGAEARALGARRAAIITDENIVASGLIETISASLRDADVEPVVCSSASMEPSDASVRQAAEELAGDHFDLCIGIGGGSCIDTAKLVNLLIHDPADLIDYLAAPQGAGRAVPDDLPPVIAVPTLSGSGAESAGAAALEFLALGAKASIVDGALRPALAIIDPLNMLSAPAAAVASAGYDALVQTLESYTARGYQQSPAAPTRRHGGMIGANPISDIWCAHALQLCKRYLVRSVFGPGDLDAHVGMAHAALYSRMGTAGAHIPHANSVAVAALARDYTPDGFPGLSRPVVPHGYAVAVTAPAAFAYTFDAMPERHRQAAIWLGASAEEAQEAGPPLLARLLAQMIDVTGGPTGLQTFGFSAADVPQLAERAAAQRRLLARAPRPADRAALLEIFTASLRGDARV